MQPFLARRGLLMYVMARTLYSMHLRCTKLQKSLHLMPLYMSNTPFREEYTAIPLPELLSKVPVLPPLRLVQKAWKNYYIGLRHGQSEANVLGIISSNPTNGVRFHGLTDLGKEQSKDAAKVLYETLNSEQLSNLVWLSSPFRRAKETMDATQAELMKLLADDASSISKMWVIEIKSELRERFFGEYDDKVLPFYNHVWPKDTINAENNDEDVESVNDVIRRMIRILSETEGRFENKTIVFVSHADSLQILQAYFNSDKIDPRQFHLYRFANCEVRDLRDLPPPKHIEYK